MRRFCHCYCYFLLCTVQVSLTEASVGDFQVPKVDPKVVCGDKMFSITVRVYRVHVICVGIREDSPEACCDRRAGHRHLW